MQAIRVRMSLAWGFDTYLIEATQLSCVRASQSLFIPVSLKLQSGDLLLVQGANGSGKSTLLRLLSGIITPATGKVCWHGIDIQDQLDHYQMQLHYVGHANGLKMGLTVTENLMLAQQLHLLGSACRTLSLQDWLIRFNLEPHQHTKVHHLSMGSRRRVALIKCMLCPKPLWILDEPLTALDKASHDLFVALLQQHLQQDGIAIISAHDATPFQSAKRLELCAC